MTQHALAGEAGVSRQNLIVIEAKRCPHSLEMASRIARVLGVPLGEAFREPAGR